MNNKLNVFKNMSQEEKIKEIKKLEGRFPSSYPCGNFTFNRTDIANLYIGRIISLLDEFGETSQWSDYAGMASVDTIIENYEKLLIRYVREYKPELLQEYIEYYDLGE